MDLDALADHGPDDGVEAGAVAAPGEDSDAHALSLDRSNLVGLTLLTLAPPGHPWGSGVSPWAAAAAARLVTRSAATGSAVPSRTVSSANAPASTSITSQIGSGPRSSSQANSTGAMALLRFQASWIIDR